MKKNQILRKAKYKYAHYCGINNAEDQQTDITTIYNNYIQQCNIAW